MKRLSEFKSCVDEDRAAIFIGAGISKIAGCDGLKDFADKLKKLKSIQEEFMRFKGRSMSQKEFFQICKDRCDKDSEFRRAFEGVKRDSLTPNPDVFNSVYIPLIKKLKSIKPFPSILTTNVDDCIENTKEFDLSKVYHLETDMRFVLFSQGGIFHLHGYKEDSNGQVWGLLDYYDRYTDEFKKFLLDVFEQYSVLFIGYNLEGDDSELRSIIAKSKANAQKRHFNLVPEEDGDLDTEKFDRLYNIEIIQYGKQCEFVDKLSGWVLNNFAFTNEEVVKEEDKEEVSSHSPSLRGDAK